MKEKFVTYDIALKLKKLGFNEKCFGFFGVENELRIEVSINSDPNLKRRGFIAAPTWQQVIDFFEENYDLHLIIEPTNLGDIAPFIKDNYGKILYNPFDNGNKGIVWPDNKARALEFGINKILEIIENGKDV